MPTPLNILCFGDSLTEGYSQYGLSMTPYSRWMRDALEEAQLGGGGSGGGGHGQEAEAERFEVKVVTRGRSGECITAGFRRRMGDEYSDAVTDLDPYDWVIFLGGTNDLGWGRSTEKIWDEIVNITDLPLHKGARVLLITIPECGARIRSLNERRADLNALIRRDEREGVYIFDLYKKIPYHSMDPTERKVIWDDGLHFKPKGYERLGKLVAERLVEILKGREGKIEPGFEGVVDRKDEEEEEEDEKEEEEEEEEWSE